MDKKKTSTERKKSLSRTRDQKENKMSKKQEKTRLSIKEEANLKEYDPVKNLLDINKMGAAIIECFINNDTEGVLEIIENLSIRCE